MELQYEDNSTLKILKIEEYPKHGKVIHISIGGLKVINPNSKEGFAEEFSHIPISEKALDESVTELKNEKPRSQKILKVTLIGRKNLTKAKPEYFLSQYLKL